MSDATPEQAVARCYCPHPPHSPRCCANCTCPQTANQTPQQAANTIREAREKVRRALGPRITEPNRYVADISVSSSEYAHLQEKAHDALDSIDAALKVLEDAANEAERNEDDLMRERDNANDMWRAARDRAVAAEVRAETLTQALDQAERDLNRVSTRLTMEGLNAVGHMIEDATARIRRVRGAPLAAATPNTEKQAGDA